MRGWDKIDYFCNLVFYRVKLSIKEKFCWKSKIISCFPKDNTKIARLFRPQNISETLRSIWSVLTPVRYEGNYLKLICPKIWYLCKKHHSPIFLLRQAIFHLLFFSVKWSEKTMSSRIRCKNKSMGWPTRHNILLSNK